MSTYRHIIVLVLLLFFFLIVVVISGFARWTSIVLVLTVVRGSIVVAAYAAVARGGRGVSASLNRRLDLVVIVVGLWASSVDLIVRFDMRRGVEVLAVRLGVVVVRGHVALLSP